MSYPSSAELFLWIQKSAALFLIRISLFLLLLGGVFFSRVVYSEEAYIVASVRPIELLIREIVGDKLPIKTLISPASDLHLHELKPSERVLLESAPLIVINGGIEKWEPVVKGKENVIRLTSFSSVRNTPLWILPEVMREASGVLLRRVCAIRPDQCQQFTENQQVLVQRLNGAHDTFSLLKKQRVKNEFVSLHAVWSALANFLEVEELGGGADCNSESDMLKILKRIRQSKDTQKLSRYLTEHLEEKHEIFSELGLSPIELDVMGARADSLSAYYEQILNAFSLVLQ